MRFPTQLTVLRIVLAPVFLLLMVYTDPPQFFWAAIVFAVAAISDWWDGHIARRMNLVSRLGAFLDPLADKLLTSAAFIAFAWLGYIEWWMVLVVLARDIYLTVFRIIGDALDLPIKTSYSAKVKTFVQMTFIVILLVALVSTRGMFGDQLKTIGWTIVAHNVLLWGMGAVTLLTFSSALMYTYDNWSVLRAAARRYVLGGQETI